MAVTEDRVTTMARKKRPSEDQPPTTPVRIDRGIVAKAKIVASDRGIDLSAYVADIMRATVDRDWAKIVKRLDSAAADVSAE